MAKVAQFAIWDKQSPIITNEGMLIPADVFISQHPAMMDDDFVTVVSAARTNGSYLGELSRMVLDYTNMGYDFSEATTNQEKIDVINFGTPSNINPYSNSDGESDPWQRIAAALELQNILTMEDVNPDPEEVE